MKLKGTNERTKVCIDHIKHLESDSFYLTRGLKDIYRKAYAYSALKKKKRKNVRPF